MAGRTSIGACLFAARAVGRYSSPAEGGYFHDFILKMEMGQYETATYEKAVTKKPLDLAGRGVRAYVEVLRGSPQEQVTDASAYQTGDEAAITEPVKRAKGIRAHVLS
jgi:hypothetical protein